MSFTELPRNLTKTIMLSFVSNLYQTHQTVSCIKATKKHFWILCQSLFSMKRIWWYINIPESCIHILQYNTNTWIWVINLHRILSKHTLHTGLPTQDETSETTIGNQYTACFLIFKIPCNCKLVSFLPNHLISLYIS